MQNKWKFLLSFDHILLLLLLLLLFFFFFFFKVSSISGDESSSYSHTSSHISTSLSGQYSWICFASIFNRNSFFFEVKKTTLDFVCPFCWWKDIFLFPSFFPWKQCFYLPFWRSAIYSSMLIFFSIFCNGNFLLLLLFIFLEMVFSSFWSDFLFPFWEGFFFPERTIISRLLCLSLSLFYS